MLLFRPKSESEILTEIWNQPGCKIPFYLIKYDIIRFKFKDNSELYFYLRNNYIYENKFIIQFNINQSSDKIYYLELYHRYAGDLFKEIIYFTKENGFIKCIEHNHWWDIQSLGRGFRIAPHHHGRSFYSGFPSTLIS